VNPESSIILRLEVKEKFRLAVCLMHCARVKDDEDDAKREETLNACLNAMMMLEKRANSDDYERRSDEGRVLC
jgi:hypothetical protein